MKKINAVRIFIGILFIHSSLMIAQESTDYFLKDRGTGIPTSMFGTYIEDGEFIIYPYYELYYDEDAEYQPSDLGYQVEEDYQGFYRANEVLLFLGYGISEELAIELEAAYISAKLEKAEDDTSSLPNVIEESGLGDVESQLRWRWMKERIDRPEFFSYFETVFPFQKEKKLIGTQDWEFKLGTGMIKGFNWGTMTVRAALEYSTSENKLDLGEYAVEYLNRVSELFRFMLAVEGTQDEVEFITDLQFHIASFAFIRVNNAFGITPKATDYAPELGILFHF